MVTRSILVRAFWDPEAAVHVASGDDVPGLVAEAATPRDLERKLQVLIPELLELNSDSANARTDGVYRGVPLNVMAEQVSTVRVQA